MTSQKGSAYCGEHDAKSRFHEARSLNSTRTRYLYKQVYTVVEVRLQVGAEIACLVRSFISDSSRTAVIVLAPESSCQLCGLQNAHQGVGHDLSIFLTHLNPSSGTAVSNVT